MPKFTKATLTLSAEYVKGLVIEGLRDAGYRPEGIKFLVHSYETGDQRDPYRVSEFNGCTVEIGGFNDRP